MSHSTAAQPHTATATPAPAHPQPGQPPPPGSSQHAAVTRPSFSPSTPLRSIHAPYPQSSTSYITPASSSASHFLPPYSTSSLPTLSALSLPPPPHSSSSTASNAPLSFPTPAKAKLNSYLVELVKNSIRITDDFSAMCRAKVAEKDAVIAQLREEIDSLRVRAAGTQTTDGDQPDDAPTMTARTEKLQADSDEKDGSGEKGSTAAAQQPPFDSADSALQYILAAKDDRIRILQAQLTSLRASAQQQQASVDASLRRLAMQRDQAEASAQWASSCYIISWLLILIVALLSFAASVHFRNHVIPAVSDFLFPILTREAQEGMLCSQSMREQCEIEKDGLLTTYEQTHSQHDHHHHHHGHDHSHPHIEEVTYQVQDCPPPVECPACPKLTCPPVLPLKEYETGHFTCLNPADADASFLLSLSKGELIMQLLAARELAESGRQWEVTHRLSKERWERERQGHAAETGALKAAAATATPVPQQPQQPANDEEVQRLQVAVSECERQRKEESSGSDELRTKLTLLQAEYERAKETLDKQDGERLKAEELAEAHCDKSTLAAVAAEHSRLTDAYEKSAESVKAQLFELTTNNEKLSAGSEALKVQLEAAANDGVAESTKARLDELTAINDKLTADSEALRVQLEAALNRTCATAEAGRDEVAGGNATAAVLLDMPVHDVAVTFDGAAWRLEKGELQAVNSALQARLDEQQLTCEVHRRAANMLVTTQAQLDEVHTNYTQLQQAFDEQRNLSASSSTELELQKRMEDKAAADATTIAELSATLQSLTSELQQLETTLATTQQKLEQTLQQLQDEQASERQLRASMGAVEDERTLNGLLVEELKVELDDMQRWYEQRLASLREQLGDEAQWEAEMEQTRAMIGALREHVQEAERMGDEVRILLASLNSTADAGAAEQLAGGLHELGDMQGVEQYAHAQLELIEARINISRLTDDKRELVRETESLQQRVHTLTLNQPLDSLATSSELSTHTSLEWEQARLSHQQQVSRLQEEVDGTKANLREAVTKSTQLQAELERAHASHPSGASATNGSVPTFHSLLASSAYLPFLPGVPLPSFFSSFARWSPVYKLLFLFALVSSDLLFFQLLLIPTRHRAYTSVLTAVWVALSAVCVHFHQFFLALFAAANALMCVWVVVQPSAALFACQLTCCGRGGGSSKKLSTALVVSNGKQQPELMSSPPPPQLLPASTTPSLPPPPATGLLPQLGSPQLPGRAGVMPPPPRTQPQSFSPLTSSRPMPPFPQSPSSRMAAPQPRRPSILSDELMVLPSASPPAASSHALPNPPPPAAGALPHFHRQPTSTRMDVMEDRPLPQTDISRATTFSSRVDIASSPAGTHLVPDADAESKDGGASDGSDLSPPADVTPKARQRVTFSDSVAPAAAPIKEGEEALSRTSSVSSDGSFLSASPLSSAYASFNSQLSHSPLALQPMPPPSFGASQPLPAAAPSSHFSASLLPAADTAYPSELAPSSYPPSAASSAVPSRRSSLSGPAGMPPMPSAGMPMPPRSAPGAGGMASAGYGRRPAFTDDDFA